MEKDMDGRWSQWLINWKSLITARVDANTGRVLSLEDISEQMKSVNPKYSLREWLLAPAYQQAAEGNYALIKELQEVMTQPYAEQSTAVEQKYYRLKPPEFSNLGGLSHMSCSSWKSSSAIDIKFRILPNAILLNMSQLKMDINAQANC